MLLDIPAESQICDIGSPEDILLIKANLSLAERWDDIAVIKY